MVLPHRSIENRTKRKIKNSSLMNHSIVLIDSHPVYINKLQGFFESLTFQNVFLASNRAVTLEVIQSKQIDLVVISAVLSDCDSKEICSMIRHKSASTKIIMLHGLFLEDVLNTVVSDGLVDVLLPKKEKDFDPLKNAVLELLNLN